MDVDIFEVEQESANALKIKKIDAFFILEVTFFESNLINYSNNSVLQSIAIRLANSFFVSLQPLFI